MSFAPRAPTFRDLDSPLDRLERDASRYVAACEAAGGRTDPVLRQAAHHLTIARRLLRDWRAHAERETPR